MLNLIDIPCPFCGALAGEKCQSRYGRPLNYFHNRRKSSLPWARMIAAREEEARLNYRGPVARFLDKVLRRTA